MHRSLTGVFLSLLIMAAGCGGVSQSASPTPPATAGNPSSPPPASGGGPVSAPAVISVGAGQTATGVNITAPAPASLPPINAEVLGVTDLNAAGSASNTGARIPRGATMRVIIFGTGLSGDLQVTIGGPSDISVSNVRSIHSTSGKPGVSFDAAVSSNAALGARTVFLRSANNDITAFTGGLEVAP